MSTLEAYRNSLTHTPKGDIGKLRVNSTDRCWPKPADGFKRFSAINVYVPGTTTRHFEIIALRTQRRVFQSSRAATASTVTGKLCRRIYLSAWYRPLTRHICFWKAPFINHPRFQAVTRTKWSDGPSISANDLDWKLTTPAIL